MALLDGKLLSEQVLLEVRQRVQDIKEKGIVPGLAVILVGEDPASQIYVRNKGKACEAAGIHSRTVLLPEIISQHQLEETIDTLNRDESVHGILVQLPLPKGLNEAAALDRIAPEKDVDGFHLLNSGRLLTGQRGVIPCTPRGMMVMLEHSGIDLDGKQAVVVGRSNIVGKPMALLLLQKDCTVTLCHSHTKELAEHTRRADVLVVAVGKPGFITGDMVKPGAVVLDVGINRVDGKLKGDVDFETVAPKASWISPVPGGVGKMTIAMLLMNTVEAAERKL